MKLKMLTRMAAMVAAGSLVVGLLAGCSVIPSKDGAADSAVATDTALILTQGDGMPALTNAEDFLNSVNVTHGGSAGLVVADGSPFVVGPQHFDQVKNNDIQQARADKTARYQLVEAVQGAAATTPETDLISAISLASRMLSAGTADSKVMVIRHSGVNTATSLPMQDLDLLNSDPAKLLDQLDAAAMLPQLNGVAVEFYGLGDVAGSQGTLSAQQVQWLKSFWQGFFDRTGANVTFHTDIVSGDALNNGHTVTPLAAAGAPTFVKVSAEQVAFQPDSTTFLDEAAARAALNGLAEQLKGTSAAHYIVAGSTAQVDNASREGAQALSLARAQAVRDVLVEAGVPADRFTCLGLGNELRLGKGEEAGGGRCRPSILADATESVFAAVYLDGGMEAARALIHRVLLDKEQEEAVEERRRDYKTELQELVQRRSNQTLHYEMIGATGPDHAKLFTCAVLLNGQMAGTGTGKSKKEAEQAAARAALQALQ